MNEDNRIPILVWFILKFDLWDEFLSEFQGKPLFLLWISGTFLWNSFEIRKITAAENRKQSRKVEILYPFERSNDVVTHHVSFDVRDYHLSCVCFKWWSQSLHTLTFSLILVLISWLISIFKLIVSYFNLFLINIFLNFRPAWHCSSFIDRWKRIWTRAAHRSQWIRTAFEVLFVI